MNFSQMGPQSGNAALAVYRNAAGEPLVTVAYDGGVTIHHEGAESEAASIFWAAIQCGGQGIVAERNAALVAERGAREECQIWKHRYRDLLAGKEVVKAAPASAALMSRLVELEAELETAIEEAARLADRVDQAAQSLSRVGSIPLHGMEAE